MTTTPSSVAQTTTGVAAGLAILYFLRPILVPFFLAVLLRILIAGIVSLVVRVLPRAPRWLILVATVGIVGFSAYSIFIVILQGMSDLVKQAPALPAQLDNLIRSVSVGFGRRFDLATVLGLIDFPSLEHNLASGGRCRIESIPYVIFLRVHASGTGGRRRSKNTQSHD